VFPKPGEEHMAKPRTIVAVVVDDESVCESLPELLRALGYDSEVFASAEEFLASGKPEVLLSAIRSALERSRAALDERASLQRLRDHHHSLSGREQEVMALVVRGQPNKQVDFALGIGEMTVKAQGGRMMQKMGARSVPELVNIATRLGLQTAGRD
jgi:FixJ family two-component response regulator